MTRESIEVLTLRDDFRPFKLITTAGVAYDITDAGALALGKSELFYYLPRSDRSIHVPYAQIAAIEETAATRKR